MILHTFTTIVGTIFHLDSNNKNISSLHYSWLYMGKFSFFVLCRTVRDPRSHCMYNFTKRILYWRELVDAAVRFQNHYTTTLHWRETNFALKVHPCMPSPSSSYQPPWPPVLGSTVHSTNIYNRAPFRSKNELTTLKMCIPPSSAQSSPACWATRSSRTS